MIEKKDGTVVNVNVGEDEDDPVVYITDLLIHLAGKQMQKKATEVIEGENLDILIGSRPLKDLEDDKKKEAVKQNVLNILIKIGNNSSATAAKEYTLSLVVGLCSTFAVVIIFIIALIISTKNKKAM